MDEAVVIYLSWRLNEGIILVDSAGGGRIFVKAANYTVSTRIDIINKAKVTIEGTDGTIFSSVVGAAVLIDENSRDITLYRLNFDSCSDKGINCKHGTNVRILECDFTNCGGPAIQARIADDELNPVENLWIAGCHIESSNLNATGNGAIHIYRTNNLFVQDNLVENNQKTGINVQHASHRVVCSNNIARNNGLEQLGHGIYIGSSSEHVTIRGNFVVGNGLNGIEAASGSVDPDELRAPLYEITDNVCTGNGVVSSGASGNGIYVTGRDHVVSNNICRDNWSDGIQIGYADRSSKIVVQGNVIGNNNSGGNSNLLWSSGISVTGPTTGSEDNQLILIKDNLIYEEDPEGNQLRSVYCQSDVGGFVIEGNRVFGPYQPLIDWDPASLNMVVRWNEGFRTEASGDTTVFYSGATSGYVEIDLAGELDVDDVIGPLDEWRFLVTPITAASGGYFNYWVTFSPDTYFTIHWESAVGLDEVGFNWRYGGE